MIDDERSIRMLVENWMSASNAGDIDTVLNLMADDVLFIVPGREPFGKSEFKAASESMRGMAMNGRAEILELQIIGDWAWIRNHIDVEMTAPGGSPVRRSGYTLTILHKQSDGQWRLARDANLVS